MPAVVRAAADEAIEAVRPHGVDAWPQNLQLKLSGVGMQEEVTLEPKGEGDGVRRLYSGRTLKQFVGIVHAELADRYSNRVVLLASEDNNTGPVQIAASATETTDQQPKQITDRPEIVIAQPGVEPALSANESSYFLVGANEDNATDARFQLSF